MARRKTSSIGDAIARSEAVRLVQPDEPPPLRVVVSFKSFTERSLNSALESFTLGEVGGVVRSIVQHHFGPTPPTWDVYLFGAGGERESILARVTREVTAFSKARRATNLSGGHIPLPHISWPFTPDSIAVIPLPADARPWEDRQVTGRLNPREDGKKKNDGTAPADAGDDARLPAVPPEAEVEPLTPTCEAPGVEQLAERISQLELLVEQQLPDFAQLRKAGRAVAITHRAIRKAIDAGRLKSHFLYDGTEVVRISDCRALWPLGGLPGRPRKHT